jgi:hypothetical protein
LAIEYRSIGVPPKKGKPVQAYAPKFGGKATIVADDDDDDDEPVAPGPRRDLATGSPALRPSNSQRGTAFRGRGGAAKISRGGGRGGKIMSYDGIYDSDNTVDNSPSKNLK